MRFEQLRHRQSAPSPACGGGLGWGLSPRVISWREPPPAALSARRPPPQAGEAKGSPRTALRRLHIMRLPWQRAGRGESERYRENACSIALRVLIVSLLSSTSTSLHRTTAPWATSFFSLTRCASPIGNAPAARLAEAGISLPHTV